MLYKYKINFAFVFTVLFLNLAFYNIPAIALQSTDKTLSKWLNIKNYPSYTYALADPKFNEELALKKNYTPIELVEKIAQAISRGTADREFFQQIAFAETNDCGGSCFSFVPYSSVISRIEVILCNNELENVCELKIFSLRNRSLIGKTELESHFGKASSCLSYAMDTYLLVCPFPKKFSDTKGEVSLFHTARQGIPDNQVYELHLKLKPASVATPVPQSSIATENYLKFLALLAYAFLPIFIFYSWRIRRLRKANQAVPNRSLAGAPIGFLLNFIFAIAGTKFWAQGKQFPDWSGFAIIFVFFGIFFIIFPWTIIITQLVLDLRKKN